MKRRHQAKRSSHQAKLFRAIEPLDCRRHLSAAVVNGTDNPDTIIVYTTSQQLVVSVNNVSQTLPLSSTDSLTIEGRAGGDTIRILENGGVPVTINAGTGHDTIQIGNGQEAVDMAGPISVNGASGEDVVVIDDSADTIGNDTYVIGATAFGKSTFSELNYTGVSVVKLIANPQANDIILQGVGFGMSMVVDGGAGHDTIHNVDNHFSNKWYGNLTLKGGAGIDALQVNDAQSTTSQAYAIDSDSFGITQINGQPATRELGYSEFESLSFKLADIASTVQVNSTVTATNILTGDGDDIVRIGDGTTTDLDNLLGLVSVAGGAGSDSMFINDQNSPRPQGVIYSISATQVSRSGNGTIYHGGMELVRLNATQQSDYVLATGSAANQTLDLQMNGGDDIVQMANDLDTNFVGDYVTINGGLGQDTVTVDDTSDEDNDSYTFNGQGSIQRFSKTGFGELTLTNTNQNQFLLNDHNNQVNIHYIALPTRINARAGNDLILVDGITGSVPTITGMLGQDKIRIDADNTGDGKAIIDTNDELAELTVGTGSWLKYSGDITLASAQTSIAGALDVGIGRFIDRSSNSASYWNTRLRNGYANGTWAGNGLASVITSAAAAESSGLAVGMKTATSPGTFGIWNYFAGDTLIGHTYAGDTDLDRDVDFDDLLKVAQNYGQTGKGWEHGNFNYDIGGVVNFDDLLSLAQNYGKTLNTFSSARAIGLVEEMEVTGQI